MCYLAHLGLVVAALFLVAQAPYLQAWPPTIHPWWTKAETEEESDEPEPKESKEEIAKDQRAGDVVNEHAHEFLNNTCSAFALVLIVPRLVLCNGTYITLNRARLINRRGLAIVWINCAAAHLLPSLGCLMRPVVADKEGRATEVVDFREGAPIGRRLIRGGGSACIGIPRGISDHVGSFLF
jgi:hypothetical protein